jgi:hypothetical protein
MDSTPYRPRESLVLVKLDQIHRESEESMKYIQNDGVISPLEKIEMLKSVSKIKALSREIEEILAPSGTYSFIKNSE